MDGQIVLVTGAGSGIGRELARASAAKGAVVHLADVAADTVNEAAEELVAGGHEAFAHVCDVADAGAVGSLFEAVLAASRRLDAAFLNAGVNGVPSMIQPGGALEDLSFEAWRRVMSINLDGLFHCLQHCARIMKGQRSGSIVVTGSTAGVRAEPRVSYPYVASKSAVTGLVKQAALELARFGVRVNAIAPGPVVTNIGGPGPRPAEAVAAWEDSIPLRRWGAPSDVTALALLLASGETTWMTGGVHTIDGGAGALTQILSSSLPAPAE